MQNKEDEEKVEHLGRHKNRRREWKTDGLEGGVDTLRCEGRGAGAATHGADFLFLQTQRLKHSGCLIDRPLMDG